MRCRPRNRARSRPSEAEDREAPQQWYAATFHLRRMLAASQAVADQLQERLKRCDHKLRQP